MARVGHHYVHEMKRQGVALTTAFVHDLPTGTIVDALLRCPCDALVLDRGLDTDRLEAIGPQVLRHYEEIPVLALEAPLPFTRESSAMLAGPDRDEVQVAVEGVAATIRRAQSLRSAFVVLNLGEIRPVAASWTIARDRFLRGELDVDSVQELVAARTVAAPRSLDAVRRALDVLIPEAERAGIVLAIRNRRRHVELPTAHEMDQLLVELRGAPIVPLFDLAAAHLLDVMGVEPLSATLGSFRSGPLTYVADACGPVGALGPGRGMVHGAVLRDLLGCDTEFVFSPWSGLSYEEVVEAAEKWRRWIASRPVAPSLKPDESAD